VVAEGGNSPKIQIVESMSPPIWEPFTDGRRRSPARGMSVAWEDSGAIWIGAPGDHRIEGGLWHGPDAGSTWEKVGGFANVTSIDLDGSGMLRVAEQGGTPRLSELELKTGQSRVMERRAGGPFAEGAAPPHGSASEIEICGTIPGDSLYYRVDNQLFRLQTTRLYRSVFQSALVR
jgi:hypothetical protein